MRTCLTFLLIIVALVIAGVAIEIFGNTRSNEQLVGAQVRTVTPVPTASPSATLAPVALPLTSTVPITAALAAAGSLSGTAPLPAPASLVPAAPQATPVSTTQPGNAALCALGQRCEASGEALTVLDVQEVGQLGLLSAGPGMTFVDIEVLIENASQNQQPYNPLDFQVKDSDGFQYDASLMTLDPSLKSGDLAPGDKVRGHVAFEVKAAAGGLVATYQATGLPGSNQGIRVALGSPSPADQSAAAAPAAPIQPAASAPADSTQSAATAPAGSTQPAAPQGTPVITAPGTGTSPPG